MAAVSGEVEGEPSEVPTAIGEGDLDGRSDAQEDIKQKKQDFCVEILPLIKEAQNQHGLRHGDYQRYRMFCTRRLRRVRRSLHFTQGHRNRYHKKTLTTETVSRVRYLYLPLVCAERAWALGMELKQDVNTEPRKRFHLLRRLNKAAKHARELLKLCEECERCDARTRLEAQAYLSWMVGNVKFEQQKWQEALDAFGQSQTIYEKLAGAVTEEQRALYSQRVEEITPNIRYCAYNMGDMPTDVSQLMKLRSDAPGSDMLASKIDLVLSKTQEKAASSLTEVSWLSKKLPVRSEKLRVSLVRVGQSDGELSRAEGAEEKMELYERLMMECQDAMQIVRDELAAEMALADKKRSQKSELQRANLQALLDYLTHTKLTHAIHRNLLFLRTMREPRTEKGGRAAKPEEFVRVYDILLQHLSELGDIPGVEEDLAVKLENTARTFSFKAFRCFHLAESYASMKKWAEALGLFDRALDHVTQALEHYRELEQERVDQSQVTELQKLQETTRGRKCEIHVSNILETQEIEDKMSDLSLTSKPLTERTDKFVLTPPTQKVTLAALPPDYRPIPCKPLFFDLALNHVEFPPLGQRVEKKQGGITGFMKGLLWGSGKS